MRVHSIMLLFISTATVAQDSTFKSFKVTSLSQFGLPADAKAIAENRRMALNFFNATNTIAEPSTVSLLGTDYTHSIDRDLQKKMYILNADIRTPIPLGGKKWIIGKQLYHSLQLIPRFRVRIFQNDSVHQDRSLPVRTPSYLPGIKYLFTHKNLWNEKNLTRHYFSIYIYHHSNGQDGSEFTRLGNINYYNGNFSEDLVFEFSYGRIKGIMPADATASIAKGNSQIKPRWIRYWNTNFEHHPKRLTNQTFLPHNLYGRNVVNFQHGWIFSPRIRDLIFSKTTGKYYAEEYKPIEKRRIILNASYILDTRLNRIEKTNISSVPYLHARRLNLECTYYEKIVRTPYASIFGQVGYYGHDTYNIYFSQSLIYFRLGFALGYFVNDYF